MTVIQTHPGRVASVSKAARVLNEVLSSEVILTVREISWRVGIPRSTVHSICATLVCEGMLELAESRGYRPGHIFLEAGAQILGEKGITEAATPVMRTLPTIPGFDAYFGLLSGAHIVYLDRRSYDPRRAAPHYSGSRAHAWRTACGKAALSTLHPDDVARRLGMMEPATPSFDPVQLGTELEQVRTRGFVVSSTFQKGRTAVGAAVTDPSGSFVGGISIAGLSARFNHAILQQTIAAVTKAAREISEHLV